MKRFYEKAAVMPEGDGYAIALDGRSVKTPLSHSLKVPVLALAEAIAGEWRAQTEKIDPECMPLTRLANTALDRVSRMREAVIGQLLDYASADLLCYRVATPLDLVRRQQTYWQPIVDWAAEALSAPLRVTQGIVAVPQPSEALAALRHKLDGYDDWVLTGLQGIVTVTGSLLLGLAVLEGRLSAEQAVTASQLDELYENELWGDDAEAGKTPEQYAS